MTVTINYIVYAVLGSIMSIIDCVFTYYYLNKLKSKGMPSPHNRELNPLGRWYMKKFGVGTTSFIISMCSSQIILWVMVLFIMPQFAFIMFGALSAVFVYHFAIYKELKRFNDDNKYWELVKYKMLRGKI